MRYAANGTKECDLSVTGTDECIIPYEVSLINTVMNGTLVNFGFGNFVPVSECTVLHSTFKQSWWQWPDKAKFGKGFDVRDPTISFVMPQLFPELASIDDPYPLCGEI